MGQERHGRELQEQRNYVFLSSASNLQKRWDPVVCLVSPCSRSAEGSYLVASWTLILFDQLDYEFLEGRGCALYFTDVWHVFGKSVSEPGKVQKR